MLLEASVIVSIIALIIGIYQWRRQRGDVNIELLEIQATVHIRMNNDSPAPIKVHGIRYEVRSKQIGLGKFLRWLRMSKKTAPGSLLHRLKYSWQKRNFIASAWCKPIANDYGARVRGARVRPQSKMFDGNILSGPSFPVTLDQYSTKSWAFDTTQYPRLFRLMRARDREKPRLCFIAPVTGHPRRSVKSKWLKIEKMHAFDQSNAWLFKDVEGWPSYDDPK